VKSSGRIALALVTAVSSAPLTPNAFGHPEPAPVSKTAIQRAVTKKEIKDFDLIDQTGNRFEFRRLSGKIVVVGFGYTTCPDVCPLITAAMRSVQEQLTPAELPAVYFLTITTDPEIDSSSVLQSYAKRYKVDFSNWSFVTGAEPALRSVWQNFGVRVQRKARGLIDHTALVAIVDQNSIMRIAYYGTAPQPQMIGQDLRRFLKTKNAR